MKARTESRRARAWALAAVLTTIAGGASAQPAREADALFQQGRALYDAGKTEEACAKLAQSQALDPSVGTLGLLAACEEKRGNLARAYKNFVEAARLAHAAKDKREAYAKERAAALLPQVPRLVIRVDAASPPERVTRDGVEVPRADLGTEILVDPGRFEIVAAAPGKGDVRRAVVAERGQRVEVVIPALAPTSAPVAPPTSDGAGLRTAAYVVGALGLVGLGVGAGFGVRAMGKNSDSKDPAVCAPAAPTCAARDDAFSSATISTAAFIAGGAALGAGVVMFVVGRPKAAPPAVSFAPAPGGGFVTFRGSF
ncbi:MAG: hypothetical protein QM820_10300 [Minicystis sp.]